jgi:WD40 repeat protein
LGLWTPKITDFGIAKDQTIAQGLTATGQILGTPSYMAPEQAQPGKWPVGPQTDIYAVGAILYEIMTGRPPFQGETALEILVQVNSQEPVPPGRLRTLVPRDLETITLKCLDKDPRKRYATALALAEDLNSFQAGKPIKARQVGAMERAWRWSRRRPLVASLLALCGMLLIGLVGTVAFYNARLERALQASQQTAEQERRQLVELEVTLGMRDATNGDTIIGTLRLVDALKLAQGHPEEADQRMQIGTTLRNCPELAQLFTFERAVLAARWTNEGGLVVGTDDGQTIRTFSLRTGQQAGPDVRLDLPLVQAALSPDCRWLAAAGAGNAVRLVELASGKVVAATCPADRVKKVAFRTDGVELLIQDSDFAVWSTPLQSAPPIRLRKVTDDSCKWSTLSADGRWLFTLAADQSGQPWDLATGKPMGPSFRVKTTITHAAFSADGTMLALVDSANGVRVWELPSGRIMAGPWQEPQPINHVALSPDHRRLAIARDDGVVQVRVVADKPEAGVTLRHAGALTKVAFSPDGRRIVTCGSDNAARVWDAVSGPPLTPLLRHNGSVIDAEVSSDSQTVTTLGNDGVARVWQLRDRAFSIAHAPSPIDQGSPQGMKVMTLEGGTAVQLVEAATGAVLGAPCRHHSLIRHVAYHGGKLATASDDNTARVWDSQAGLPLTPALVHKGTVTFVAFSADGRWLATASEDRTARVWNAQTGQPLTPPLNHPGPVARAWFEAGNSQLFTLGADRQIRAWSLAKEDQPLAVLEDLTRALTGMDISSANQEAVPLSTQSLHDAWRHVRARERTNSRP